MDDLTGEFIAETRETLEHIGDALIAWEANPAETARLDEIFRFVHTVKGSCGFLDLVRIEALAHAAESVLGALRNESRAADARLVGAMLALIDRIALLTEALETDQEFPPVDTDQQLIAALDPVAVVTAEPARVPETVIVKSTRNVRIAVDLLDAMMNQVSDLVLVRNELARALQTSRGDTDAELTLDRLSARVGDLRDSVARARLQPVERLFAALPRLVRDTAAELDKAVQLTIDGSDVELDREMVEELRDPLIHIVRNAIDHGIETRTERRAVGKSADARLGVTARQSGNQVVIEISDDGRGIDIARLRAKAVDAGVIDARRAAAMSDDDATQLIFAPGLSTAAAITAISGRGIGMDVVRANVEKLGGTIVLTNRPGSGLMVELRAPLTLSIVTVLTIRSGAQRFAIPRGVVDEVFAIAASGVRLDRVGAGQVATLRGETLTVVSLGDALGIADAAVAHQPTHLIVIEAQSGCRWALAVDEVCDHIEVVVRPVAPLVAAIGIFAGQTLPDAGLPLLLIDVIGLARRAKVDATRIGLRESISHDVAATTALLTFTGLDGCRRAIHAHLLERIEDIAVTAFANHGKSMLVSIDGRLCAALVMGKLPADGMVALLKVSDGAAIVGIPIAEAHDLVDVPVADIVVDGDGAAALIDGVIVTILDAHALFAKASQLHVHSQQLVAISGGDDSWRQTILAPLIEAAGYRVSFDPADRAAAITVCLDGADAPDGRPVVHLHGNAAARTTKSIDRYDRKGITRALGLALTQSEKAG